MNDLKIAFIPLIRTTFDVELARQMVEAARQALAAAGIQLSGPAEPVTSLEDAANAARELAGETPDLLLIFQATFADSTMVCELTAGTQAPVFLWAVPEPWTGERLRLNSLCGINLAAHALTLRGQKYHYAYADPGDPVVLRQIQTLAAAGRLRRRLQSARLGVVGHHPDGLDTCRLDAPGLRSTFGVQVEQIDLQDVFARVRQAPAAALQSTGEALDARLDNLDELEQEPLNRSLGVYHALKEVAAELRLDGLAVRCWPEFFTELGCAACGAMSMLSDGFGGDAPLPCSCEADINGTLTQLMLAWLADSPSFGTDIVGVDLQEDRVALWHCGLAPLSMADPAVRPQGTIHSNRRKPLLMDFPLKPGTVTLARISQSTGRLRLVVGKGVMIAGPKPFSGTAGILKPAASAQSFLDVIMREGLEHHISLVYGDFTAELKAFASLIELPVLEL